MRSRPCLTIHLATLLDLSHDRARAALETGAPAFLFINPVAHHGPHLPLHNPAIEEGVELREDPRDRLRRVIPRRSSRLLLLAAALLLCSCHRTEKFESVCQLIRADAVEVDDKGVTQIFDVEFEWDPCPGEQFQVVRGGAEFAACMKQHASGDLLPVEVEHFWTARGYYQWEVTKVGGCDRPMDLAAEGSYEKSQECSEVIQHGQKVGFTCSRKPFARLVDVCPWMARN